MKKVSKSIQNRINKINDLIPFVNKSDNLAWTMGGSTYASYVVLTRAIETKNQFVYIHADKSYSGYGFNKRYNVNNESQSEALKYDLAIIIRAFNSLIKNQH